jgi:hypothetical protein
MASSRVIARARSPQWFRRPSTRRTGGRQARTRTRRGTQPLRPRHPASLPEAISQFEFIHLKSSRLKSTKEES